MAVVRSKPFHLQLVLASLFSAVVCVLAVPGHPHSPDLICHTSNPDECYPKIFQATNQFQPVHDDQDLPKGLHVRLNVWTGRKEAKINVPGEGDASLEGLPVDKAVVVVDPDPSQQQDQQDTTKIAKGAPKYEPVGKVKGPEHEAGPFYEGLKTLKKGTRTSGQALDTAMDGLEDLSHDLYYGLKLAEDSDAVKALFCLMSRPQAHGPDGAVPRDQQAAAILAGALQNNPTALKQVSKLWPHLEEWRCSKNDNNSLRLSLYSSVLPTQTIDGSDAHRAAARVKPKIAVINGLIKDASIRADFLDSGGMELLLGVMLPMDKEWEDAQRKAGQLVSDTFLDRDMGALLGQWPTSPPLSDAECKTAEHAAAEGCWDYHVARIAKATRASKGDWSRDLSDRLAAVRKPRSDDDRGEL